MFSLENPETTVVQYKSVNSEVTESEIAPDLVVRKNFSGDWGKWSIAGIGRTLNRRDVKERSAAAYGITTGGKLKLGKNGDDLRIMATYGSGLGRYLAAGFVAAAVVSPNEDLNPINTVNGYIAYNHFWVPNKWSSSFSVSAFEAMHEEDIVGDGINKTAYSLSGNIKYDPAPQLRFGIEYMYAYRELQAAANGAFHRIQIAAKYSFGYANSVNNEKR